MSIVILKLLKLVWRSVQEAGAAHSVYQLDPDKRESAKAKPAPRTRKL
jgi:hypothetical protein